MKDVRVYHFRYRDNSLITDMYNGNIVTFCSYFWQDHMARIYWPMQLKYKNIYFNPGNAQIASCAWVNLTPTFSQGKRDHV